MALPREAPLKVEAPRGCIGWMEYKRPLGQCRLAWVRQLLLYIPELPCPMLRLYTGWALHIPVWLFLEISSGQILNEA